MPCLASRCAVLASDAHKVALRGDLARLAGKVAILSGGGSGHEPSHVGWVGEGMLAGAVCGEVFASPSAASAAAAGRAVAAAGASGVLFVIKNYTGDRLNFGFAVEALKSEGVAAEMVVVGEDCAIRAEQVGVAGRRGLAGTALVHKVAGAAAARGAPLTEVAEAARRAAGCIATMGVALSPCALPGAARPERLAEGEIEVGLGIHGEPGCYKRKAGTAREVVAELLEHISSTFMPLESGGRYALLVNSLGATPPGELSVVANEALEWLRRRECLAERLITGCLMSALDMAGMSLTLMRIDDAALLEALDAPTAAPAWPKVLARPAEAAKLGAPQREVAEVAPRVASSSGSGSGGLSVSREACDGLKRAVAAASSALVAIEGELAELDAAAGDGDCGATMRRGAEAAAAAAASLPGHFAPSALAAALAEVAQSVMGGTSGAIYSILFAAMQAKLIEADSDAPPLVTGAAAFAAGVRAVSEYGGAGVGDRTMVDSLAPAAEALREATMGGAAAVDALSAAAAAAAAGAARTAGMAARAGRASYVATEALAREDPGARAVAVWLAAAAKA